MDFSSLCLLLKTGWRSIVVCSLLGGVLGIGLALSLPEKYYASAVIEPSRVLGKYVEEAQVLVERMRSPTYYSNETVGMCGLQERTDGPGALAAALRPRVPGGDEGEYVSSSFKAESRDVAIACLESVLHDIRINQRSLMLSQVDSAQSQLNEKEKRLALAENFASTGSDIRALFDFNDSQFSASALLVTKLMEEQKNALELEKEVQDLKRELLEPLTKEASFAVPIYAPVTSAEPKKVLVITLAFLFGLFVGVMVVFIRTYVKKTAND